MTPPPGDLDLEFPDWSGMIKAPRSMTLEASFRMSEEYRSCFSTLAVQSEWHSSEKIPVEFVL